MTALSRFDPPRPEPSNFATERAMAIGSRLRQIFEEAAAEPIPETFEELLRKLG